MSRACTWPRGRDASRPAAPPKADSLSRERRRWQNWEAAVFRFAWPSASIAVMGGEQAAQTLLSLQVGKREMSEAEKAAMLADIRSRYDATMDPRYAASRLWVDGIIDPRRTREVVASCLDACAHQGPLESFRWGVLQT